MITAGEPGKVTPYTLCVGVCNCISYHRDGRFKPRCGSLQRMGRRLFVFAPFTAQLLLPLFLSGFSSGVGPVKLVHKKYSESVLNGICGRSLGTGKWVPLGMMGSSESFVMGYSASKSSWLSTLRTLVCSISFSLPVSS